MWCAPRCGGTTRGDRVTRVAVSDGGRLRAALHRAVLE
eukprot:gene5451-1900_t